MKLALENSNLEANKLNYINAHSTSTPAGDLAEINSIKKLFDSLDRSKFTDVQQNVYISSLKGSLGNPIKLNNFLMG